MSDAIRILRLDASAKPGASASRHLGDELPQRISAAQGSTIELRVRDLNRDAEFIDAEFIDTDWIEANLDEPSRRNATANRQLACPHRLIAEPQWADYVLLTTAMCNLGVPATAKAWVDQVCRAGITFRYGKHGPKGLLAGKRADIVVTTGAATLGSPVDFVSGYLRQVFSFIGIDDVDIISAGRVNLDSAESISRALQQIDERYPAAAA